MKREIAKEVVACLPKGRTLFHYSKDDYAFHLLHLLKKDGEEIRNVRSSSLARLLEKPRVKPYLAECCDGKLHQDLIPRQQFLPEGQNYRLSLDVWGENVTQWRDNQVSRKGVSLVLQMNLNRNHFTKLSRCADLDDYDPFGGWGHPAREGKYPTLSWCRLDFDLQTGEALIEEIQTDLLREMKDLAKRAYRAKKRKKEEVSFYGTDFKTTRFLDYWEREFCHHEKTWHEAMLSAAIVFLIEEIGMRTVYYHTHQSGKFLKRIDGTLPPVSLYTKLPKQFCFEKTREAPELLCREEGWKRRMRATNQELEFFRMAV